ncbi:MAG: ATP-binding protein [Candidatus Kryptonium sp.]|nr:ATP-binding protein [Candidatus Kryptonium sp.]MCX7761543.1 ATP-binding protein [Candidatus Kryptonium sp.]MDW8109395.1 ATP-binding protein [Candidatus Kryptonium sp.]
MEKTRIKFFIFLILTVSLLLLKPWLGILSAIVFGLWCLKKIIIPLSEIENKIRNFFDLKKLPVDEITSQKLERGIDKLINECEKSQRKLSESERNLNVFLESLPDAVLVLKPNGKVKFYNHKFWDIFSKSGVLIQFDERYKTEKFYWEIIRDFNLIDFIKNVIEASESQAGTVISREIESDEKTFNVSAFKSEANEIFIIFEDITFAKELAEIKRELIENISHELKTPLSNIKGYIETIEEELENFAKKSKRAREILIYLEPVKRNTDRLIRIINDLLILSEVEAGVKFEEENINFGKIINGILKMYEKNLKDKKLSCDVKISNELPEFRADSYRIEQMLFNLIDNAIKYTDSGGIKICVEPFKNYPEKGASAIKITVEDTGIGIPKEHIPRIFERFYVVDKSRSRQTGGTGLGLSIVKHIVLMYNGTINVESKVGMGTKFEIIFPVKRQGKF